MNTCVGPTLFPTVQVSLRLGHALKTLPFKRRFLGVTDARFDLALSIRILNAARESDSSVVSQQVPVKRIDRSIVDVRCGHPFPQVIEDDDLGVPPSLLKAVSCSSAQMRELDWKLNSRTHFRLKPNVSTNNRVRRYFRCPDRAPCWTTCM